MPNLITDSIKSMLPLGSAWDFADDDFFEALGENFLSCKDFLSKLAKIRDPYNTDILSDLEKEYGILTDARIGDELRRAQLATRVYNANVNGTATTLQAKLNAAGFDVLVHKNDPPVDPAQFIDRSFNMIAGGDNAYAGRPDAFAGITGGEYLVNGALFSQLPIYLSSASYMFAGGQNSNAGYFEDYSENPYNFYTPADPNTWGFIFFVGGTATRNINGELTKIEQVNIPAERENEFKKIILRYKPLYTWAGLVVVFA